jgi:hypothetical protein
MGVQAAWQPVRAFSHHPGYRSADQSVFLRDLPYCHAFSHALNDAKVNWRMSRLEDQKYCYNFTPKRNVPYSLIVSSGGIGILVIAVFLFIWLSLNSKNRKPRQYPE